MFFNYFIFTLLSLAFLAKERIFFFNYMSDLYFLPDLNNGFNIEFLNVVAFVSFFSGVLVIVSKNPIISVLYLILLFSTIACYLMFVGIKFLGLAYLLVYVGAVSILFLFILMLINIRVSELISDTKNSLPLAFLVISAFFIPFSLLLPNNKISFTNINFNTSLLNLDVYHTSSNSWDGNLVDVTDITSIGNVMYTNYSLWLIITSLILLLAMVGSIIVTIKQRY
jgi:NADH-ubiquinone oxidoreductase chain 6